MRNPVRYLGKAIRWLSPLVFVAAAHAQSQLEPQPMQGLDNPTLAYNLAPLNDWSSAQPFLNLMRTARPWMGHGAGKWAKLSNDDLRRRGILDAQGWPQFIPDDVDSIGTILDWRATSASLPQIAQNRRGLYVLRYDGDGKLLVSGDVEIEREGKGEVVFRNLSGGHISIEIVETDPHATGEYIRNITLIPEAHVGLFDAGVIFHHEWIEAISDARQIRFMNWMDTNESKVARWEDWSEKNPPADRTSIGEIIALSNHIGADPWITVPHLADADFNRKMAQMFHDELDPNLSIRVEFSNEVWNGAFAQHHWMKQQSQQEWGVVAPHDYYAKKAVETAQIWNDVFGAESADRLVHVISSQAYNPWLGGEILNAKLWKKHDKARFKPPSDVFDEIAIAPYAGTHFLFERADALAFSRALKAGQHEAAAWLDAAFRDKTRRSSLPDVATYLDDYRALADANSLNLVAYEGGQHLLFPVANRDAQTASVAAGLTQYLRSESAADLYSQLWQEWTRWGQGPFMQFNAVSAPNDYGNWGVRAFPRDNPPRAKRLDALNSTTQIWWDAQSCDCYLHGVTKIGGPQDELFLGTDAEDAFDGGAGDDRFVLGKARDHVNGGAGTDTIVLPGAVDDWTITRDGRRIVVMGNMGEKHVVGVEFVTFEDGKTIELGSP